MHVSSSLQKNFPMLVTYLILCPSPKKIKVLNLPMAIRLKICFSDKTWFQKTNHGKSKAIQDHKMARPVWCFLIGCV